MTGYVSEDNRNIEIRHIHDLLSYFTSAFKPKENWRVGVECEHFFIKENGKPFSYREDVVPLFQALIKKGWQPIEAESKLVGLSRGESFIALEPGMQIELSGAPYGSCHEVQEEVQNYFSEMKAIAREADMPFSVLASGFLPQWRFRDSWHEPIKTRAQIMERYMRERGDGPGLDMMFRTASIQASLDFSDETDLIQKLQISLKLQPIVAALFSNSPFHDGKESGFLSYRGHIWNRLDRQRTNLLPQALQPDFNLEKYIDHALSVPMYFVYRNGKHIPAGNMTFKKFMQSSFYNASLYDFTLHLTTLFPEVRIKKVIEMRGADNAGEKHIAALAALWVGLLYDQDALEEMREMTKDWDVESILQLKEDVPRMGLDGKVAGEKVQTWARKLVACAASALERRGKNEQVYLQPLWETLESGLTPAHKALARYRAGEKLQDIFKLW